MTSDLELLLYTRHPEIFAGRTLPREQSNMHWGIQCGNGWFALIDALCAEIDWQVKENAMPPVLATDVKEKAGSLRFRFHGGNEATRAMAAFALRLSEHICSDCGRVSAAV